MGKTRRAVHSPLQRGWTSANPQGRKFGPPMPEGVDEDTLENFDTVLIESRRLIPMTSQFARVPKLRLLMVTGNGDGLCGYRHVAHVQLTQCKQTAVIFKIVNNQLSLFKNVNKQLSNLGWTWATCLSKPSAIFQLQNLPHRCLYLIQASWPHFLP